MKKVNWIEIVVFSVVATLVSAPFRLGWILPQEYFQLPAGLNNFFLVLRGIGPIAGFAFMYYVWKSKVPRQNTFFGNDHRASLIAIAVIPLGLTIWGVRNGAGLNENYFGFIYGMTLVLYAICEEYGWRGYLQGALEPLSKPVRIFVIAVIWFVWHLNFISSDMTWQSHLIHFAALVAGAWGLMQITNMTRSILFASAVHLSFNLFSDVRGDFQGRLVVLACAVAVWIFLLRRNSRVKILRAS